MSTLHTFILGVVEGITEFLPISSTAHLEITQQLLRMPTTDFIKSFDIIIQLGAITAVMVLYARKILSSSRYFFNICIAFIPTGILGFLLYKIIKSFFLGNIALAAIMLVLGGIVIILFESKHTEDTSALSSRTIESLTTRQLLILGTIQALAVIPGISRSGAVIIGGRMLGLPRMLIAEFSFLLAIPTMLAAAGYDILKSGFLFGRSEWGTIALGFSVSFIVALLVVKWLLAYIKTHSFKAFGWYRIILGIIIFLTLYA